MSAILKSTSCPTAATMGSALAAMALGDYFSLKAQRSSSEPPPRPTIRRVELYLALALPAVGPLDGGCNLWFPALNRNREQGHLDEGSGAAVR